MARTIGNRIAPPRFVAYGAALVAVAAFALTRGDDRLRDFLIGFDVATAAFLLSTIPLFRTLVRNADDQLLARLAL